MAQSMRAAHRSERASLGHPLVWLRQHWQWVAVALGGAVVGWGVFATWISAIEYTNHTEFCITCHVMKDTVYPEYLQSSHYRNKLGVHVGCPDCHVPQYNWVSEAMVKVGTVTELYKFFTAYYFGGMDSIEKFDRTRPELAKAVWAKFYANNARECRHCHDYGNMVSEEQKPSARSMHADAMKTNANCIDCHKGLTHKNFAAPAKTEAPTSFDVQ